MNEASRQRGIKAPSEAKVFFRGVRVGPLAVALLAVIGAAIETERRLKAEGGRRKAEGAGHLYCSGLLCLVASMPSLAAMGDETMWAWFLIGGMFGVFGWASLKFFENWDRLKSEFGEDRLNGPLNGGALREKLHAMVLTEGEHLEMLVQCHAGAMRHPLRKVDLRGVPVLWGLSAEQRERFLQWADGRTIFCEREPWTATVREDAGFTFLCFAAGIRERGAVGSDDLPPSALRPPPSVEPRKDTSKIIVAKGRGRS